MRNLMVKTRMMMDWRILVDWLRPMIRQWRCVGGELPKVTTRLTCPVPVMVEELIQRRPRY